MSNHNQHSLSKLTETEEDRDLIKHFTAEINKVYCVFEKNAKNIAICFSIVCIKHKLAPFATT